MAAFRLDASTPAIYSVWRLDGATPALAKGLVDKAKAAETSGLHGVGRFDRIIADRPLDGGTPAGDWNILRAGRAALYTGWYSYGRYPDAFTWNTGGSWKGVYGADGFIVLGDTASYPLYATVSATGNSY